MKCTPKFVFNIGKTLCSGYTFLLRDLVFLDLTVQYINYYSKRFAYESWKLFIYKINWLLLNYYKSKKINKYF